VPERTLRRRAARFDAHGMRSLFDLNALALPPTTCRGLPADIRRAIVALKADGQDTGVWPEHRRPAQAAVYAGTSRRMASASFSATATTVQWRLARGPLGKIAASATRSPATL
jgi:hypothetical protein